MPVGESMKSGVAVLASNQTSLPEVGGDAVHYVDPFSESNIVLGLLKLDQDQEYRTSLIEKGFQQVAQFSWDTTAKEVWKVLKNSLN